MLPFSSFFLSIFFTPPTPSPPLVFRYYIERRADRPHGYCAGIKLKLRSRTARGSREKKFRLAEAACRKIPGRRTRRMGIPIEAATGGSRDGKHNRRCISRRSLFQRTRNPRSVVAAVPSGFIRTGRGIFWNIVHFLHYKLFLFQ